MIVLMMSAAFADCGLAELDSTMESIEGAFAEMSEGFEPLRARFEERLGCLAEPLNRRRAARIHRTAALFHFFDEDDAATRASFARYRFLDRQAELPEALAPREHPLRKLFEASVDDSTAPLPPPAEGWLLVDGEQQEEAPRKMPFVLQHVTEDGAVTTTGLVPPKGDLPFYDRAAPQPLPAPPSEAPEPTRSRQVKPLMVAGIGVAGVGLISYAAAFGTRGAYKNAVDAGDRSRIGSTHRTTNILTVTGLGLTAAGAGIAIGGAL